MEQSIMNYFINMLYRLMNQPTIICSKTHTSKFGSAYLWIDKILSAKEVRMVSYEPDW